MAPGFFFLIEHFLNPILNSCEILSRESKYKPWQFMEFLFIEKNAKPRKHLKNMA